MRRAARMQETVTFMEQKQRDERPRISSEISSKLQSVEDKNACRRLEEGGGVVQPIWPVCLDEIVGCISGEERKE